MNFTMLQLTACGQSLRFYGVNFNLQKIGLTDLFALKNNKTVRETLSSSKYGHLKCECETRYPFAGQEKLGEFLLKLKRSGDVFYRKFLNKYGDLK